MEKHTSKLIQGEFNRDKAKTLLFELFSYKINYHRMQKFSDEERFGKDREHSETRIRELLKERQELMDWINGLKDSDMLDIRCDVKLEVTA